SNRIKAIPVFQTNGQFDFQKYAKFSDDKLGPRGFTIQQLEDVVRDSLRLELVRAVVTAPVTVSKSEVEEAERMMQKVDVQSVYFPLEAARAAVKVTEEEISNIFTQNEKVLISPETRVVDYVEFTLPADSKAAEGKEKVDALQKLVAAS